MISSFGVSCAAAMPSAARACGDTGIDFSARDQMPPPAEIRRVS